MLLIWKDNKQQGMWREVFDNQIDLKYALNSEVGGSGIYKVTVHACKVEGSPNYLAIGDSPEKALAAAPELIFADNAAYDIPAGTKGESYTATTAFTATGGTAPYQFTVEPAVTGLTINSENKFVYTRPAVQGATTTTIKVTDSANVSKTITITIGAVTSAISSVTVTPETVSVQKGTTQAFSATVTGTGDFDETVNWTVEGGIAGTTISSAGVLAVAAGETASTLTVKATANDDNTKYDTATVTVTAPELIFADNAAYDIPAGTKGESYTATTAFTATGGTAPYQFTVEPAVTGLTINSENKFVYTRPAVQGATTTTIKVTDSANVSKTITITIGAVTSAISSVTVTPETVSVQKGTTQAFSATVTGTGDFDETVNWTVEGGITGTTISSAGVLTVAAGETASTLTVKATANGDDTKYDTVTVTVTTGLTFSFASGKATVTGFSAPSEFSGELTIPSSIGGVPVAGIAGDALVNGSAITSISIPSSVTSIGDGLFSDCAQLTAINVDAGNPVYKSAGGILYSKDGTELLSYPMGKAGDFSIPNSVTTINGGAFSGCTGLTSISIPESVTSIGDGAFSGCTNLSTATFYGNAPTMGTGVFAGSASNFIVRYVNTATGFTNPWNGYPTRLLCEASVSYRTHVQDVGWQGYVSNGAASGTSGQSKRLEAINIKVGLQGISGGIEYRTHVQDIGWQGWVANDALSGTSAQSKRLEAIQIRLTGDLADAFDVYYRVHAQDTGWMGWAKNGESAGTAGYSRRLEAIEVKLVEKGDSAPGTTARPFIQNSEPVTAPTVSYKTHVQDVGWQSYVSDGAVSGTSGQSKRLEGIQIKLGNIAGGIEYSTHVQDIGWQGFVANDAMSGTSGQSKRLEAIKIRLTGAAAEAYDIYYCVHAQDTGWLDWAKNGEAAGTAAFSYRLEAIKIVLVPKGGPAPGPTARAFVQG